MGKVKEGCIGTAYNPFMNVCDDILGRSSLHQSNSLANLQPQEVWVDVPQKWYGIPQQEETKEDAMRVNLDTNYDNSKDYVLRRLENLLWTKRNEIYSEYEEVSPKTLKEAREWLKSGNVRLSSVDDMSDDCFYVGDLMWGKTAPDYKKRDERVRRLEAAHVAAKDVVCVLSDEATRLKTLQEFESLTIN